MNIGEPQLADVGAAGRIQEVDVVERIQGLSSAPTEEIDSFRACIIFRTPERQEASTKGEEVDSPLGAVHSIRRYSLIAAAAIDRAPHRRIGKGHPHLR